MWKNKGMFQTTNQLLNDHGEVPYFEFSFSSKIKHIIIPIIIPITIPVVTALINRSQKVHNWDTLFEFTSKIVKSC
jgi:hypothetical protein